MHRQTAAALLVLMFSGPALAQSSPGIQPNSTDTNKMKKDTHNACFRDVNRYCSDAIPDEMKILACLQDHRKRLSKGCEKLLKENGQ